MLANNSLFLSNAVLANYKAWVQWVHDMLAAAGWVQIHFTGELDIAAIAAVPGATTFSGYELWQTAVSAGLTPFYFRIGYGSSSASAPAISMQVGWAYNAANGTLTGTFQSGVFVPQVSSAVASANPWQISADGQRFAIIAGTNATAGSNILIGMVERSRDDAGAYSNDGIYQLSLGANNQVNYIPQLSASATPLGHGAVLALPSSIPSLVSLVNNNNAPVSPLYFYKGAPIPPPISLMGFWAPDFSTGSTNAIEVYGIPRNYLFVGGTNASLSYTSWRIAILQE